MRKKPVVCIIGCGYVGLTTAAVLANAGFEVRAIEVSPERLRIIRSGRSFFYEVGVDSLLEAAFAKKSLRVTNSYSEAVPGSDVVFSCVGTPDNPDGSSNLSYVFDAAAQAAISMEPGTIFVQKSTVPVGTGEKIERTFREAGAEVRYVSNPEFLREGTAISDTLWPDRVVAGGVDGPAIQVVLDVYKAVELDCDKIGDAAGIRQPAFVPKTQYIQTSRNSAELIKVTANAFLALKISFANSIAKLADKTEADVVEVMDAVGSDPRIGRAFLHAGRGYGGGCFPKDVSGLIRSAEEYGVAMEIMQAATEVNESMPHYIIHKTKAAFQDMGDDSFEGRKIAVLGLAFKAGTSDARRSPGLAIANTLAQQGAKVRAYDPEAMDEARERVDARVTLCNSWEAAVRGSDCIFVATDWPEFTRLEPSDMARISGAKVFVDCMNRFDSAQFADTSLRYIGVGRR